MMKTVVIEDVFMKKKLAVNARSVELFYTISSRQTSARVVYRCCKCFSCMAAPAFLPTSTVFLSQCSSVIAIGRPLVDSSISTLSSGDAPVL